MARANELRGFSPARRRSRTRRKPYCGRQPGSFLAQAFTYTRSILLQIDAAVKKFIGFHGRELIVAVKQLAQVLRGRLCHAVDVLGNGSGVLGHPGRRRSCRWSKCVAEYAGRTGEVKGTGAYKCRLFEQIERSRDIDVDELVSSVGPDMRFVQRSRMNDRVHAFHAASHARAICDRPYCEPQSIPSGAGPSRIRRRMRSSLRRRDASTRLVSLARAASASDGSTETIDCRSPRLRIPCPVLPTDKAPPADYNVIVEKSVRVFSSFEDADEADARYDAAMSPEERLSILIELRDRRHPDAAEQRLARVSRVVELERS